MTVQDPTTNYGWPLPNVGGDGGSWGAMIRTYIGDDVTGVDAIVYAISVVADAAMPKAGGIFTGDVEYAAGSRLIEDDTAMAALELDWALGNFHSKTLANGGQSITFANYPASGKVQFITLGLIQGAGGTSTVSWPASEQWQDGVAPTLSTTAAGVDVLVFFTRDGGTTVIGAHSITDPS